MKTVLMLVLAVTFTVLSFRGSANALPFESYYLTASPLDDITVTDSAPYSFFHTINFDPIAQSINSATLTLSYADVSAPPPGSGDTKPERELWAISYGDGSSSVFIGNLSPQPNSNFTTQDFLLPESVYDGIGGSSWTFQVRFNESTINPVGADEWFKLDYSYLHGDYTSRDVFSPQSAAPVPEPSTMVLLGMGLVGTGAYRLRKRIACQPAHAGQGGTDTPNQ